MGSLQASEMAGLVRAGLKRKIALEWHLRHNHYPPVPLYMVPAAEEAIANAQKGELDKEIRLPKGVYCDGRNVLSTSEVIDNLNLDTFIDEEE